MSLGALFAGLSENRRNECLPELFYLSQSSIYLVTHRGDDIIDRNLTFFVNKSLSPDLGVHLVSSLQVLADGVFIFCDLSLFLAAMNVDAGLRLAKHSATNQIEQD